MAIIFLCIIEKYTEKCPNVLLEIKSYILAERSVYTSGGALSADIMHVCE